MLFSQNLCLITLMSEPLFVSAIREGEFLFPLSRRREGKTVKKKIEKGKTVVRPRLLRLYMTKDTKLTYSY